MTANVVSLFRRITGARDWSAAEVAEFYRVEAALVQAGISVETERGLSDEGEPWFAFCRADTGEVIVHIARIGANYVLAGPAFEGIAQGKDIHLMIADLLSRHPTVNIGGRSRESNILLHPAMLLVAVVCTAFFKTSEAQALTELGPQDPDVDRASGTARLASWSRTNSEATWVAIDAAQVAIMITAVASVLEYSREAFDDSEVSATAAVKLPTIVIDAPGSQDKDVAALQPSAHGWQTLDQTEGAHRARSDHDDVSFQGQQAGVSDGPQLLALLGVLWDLDKGPARPAASSIEPRLDAHSAVHEDVGEYRPSAARHSVDQPQLLLEIAQSKDGLLPNVQSALVLQADGFATKLQASQIAHVVELPTALENVILAGAHIHVDTVVDLPELATQAQDNIAEFPPDDVEFHADDLNGILGHFFSTAGNVATIVKGDDLVIYDVEATTDHPTDLMSYTWDFADGSSLSLVGLPASLPDSHHLAA